MLSPNLVNTYATNVEKAFSGFKYVFIESTQENIKKCITWPKKLKKTSNNETMLGLKLV
jgi:hypothetical protein